MVDIPADHKIFLELPPELPVGKAKITITAQTEKPSDNPHEAIKNLRGITKRMGSSITAERFREMRQEDAHLEEEKYRRFFAAKE